MVFLVGLWWSVIFILLTVVAIVIAIGMFLDNRKVIGCVMIVVTLIFGYLGAFSILHVNIPINNKALLIDHAEQKVIGIGKAGVNTRSINTDVILWPANNRYLIEIWMQKGTESATCKDNTAIIVGLNFYLDLSDMDIESAYYAINGDFSLFFQSNLRVGALNAAREVAINYTAEEHTTKRNGWESDFETAYEKYLEENGFGIKIIKGITTQSWDFSSDTVAQEYDAANVAIYTQKKNENQKAALLTEEEMAKIRANMLSLTADGTIDSLTKISAFFQNQPEDVRPYLVNYLSTIVNLEYLRLVGEQKPAQFLPPNSNVVSTFDTNNQPTTTYTVPEITGN